MPPETVGRMMEILLVEDDLVQARLTMEALKRGQFQHRLTWLRDGREALDFVFRRGVYVRAPLPDLILLDLRLPELDGLDVLQAIRQDFASKPIPVVIMTSSEDQQDQLTCQALDVEAYLTKPVDLDKFLALVKQLKRFWHEDVILPSV